MDNFPSQRFSCGVGFMEQWKILLGCGNYLIPGRTCSFPTNAGVSDIVGYSISVRYHRNRSKKKGGDDGTKRIGHPMGNGGNIIYSRSCKTLSY